MTAPRRDGTVYEVATLDDGGWAGEEFHSLPKAIQSAKDFAEEGRVLAIEVTQITTEVLFRSKVILVDQRPPTPKRESEVRT
jgi:hypothetical protein